MAVASLGITGANKAQDLGQAWLLIAVYGVISAAFGGVLRDVVVNEFPLMFKPACCWPKRCSSAALRSQGWN